MNEDQFLALLNFHLETCATRVDLIRGLYRFVFVHGGKLDDPFVQKALNALGGKFDENH